MRSEAMLYMEAILQKVHTASWRRFLKETNKV